MTIINNSYYNGINPYYNTNANVNNYSQFNAQTKLIKVNGIEGARAFQMQPNQVAPLFDENENVFFIKITDGAGFPTIRTFDFTERRVETREEEKKYVTVEDFEKFKKELLGGLKSE